MCLTAYNSYNSYNSYSSYSSYKSILLNGLNQAMDEYITLISPSDKATNFSTQFDSTIALNDTFEVGLTEIFHAGVCNICSNNNHFYIASFKATSGSVRNLNPHKNSTRLTIPTGFYKSTIDVIEAIKVSVDGFTRQGGRNGKWFETDLDKPLTTITYLSKSKSDRRANPIGPYEDEIISVKLSLDSKDLKFYQPKSETTTLTLLGKGSNSLTGELHVVNSELESNDDIGLIYCSLVKSSRLNNKNTNLLAIIPLARGLTSKYTHYSVTNPTYYPIAVTSFERIHIEIRNVIQKPIHIQHLSLEDQALYPTILTLHIRKRRQ